MQTDQNSEFDRQVETLIKKGYPKIINVSTEKFVASLQPLREKLQQADITFTEHAGHLPFVLVIKSDLIPLDEAVSLIKREKELGFISLYPVSLDQFAPIPEVSLPQGSAYLLCDIDRGEATRNVAPEEALTSIQTQNRSPLTIEEGIAILTHFPDFLQKNHCFSMLGSRLGDKRVPAFWLSENKPKLGWCWEGNPHTWLGSASCAKRVGSV